MGHGRRADSDPRRGLTRSVKGPILTLLLAGAVGFLGCRSKADGPESSATPVLQKPADPATQAASPSPPKTTRTDVPAKPAKITQATGLALPEGFTATIFAVVEGVARHLAVRENGDVYVRLRRSEDGMSTVGLRDQDGDGRADLIWPYTYYDQRRNARMVAPEYGGDGKTEAEPGKYPDPLYAFPGHYAPNDLIFYRGTMFPKRYLHGAFIAFHGSWNRAPLPQEGYHVAFVPFEGRRPSGPAEIFADGFTKKKPLDSPGNAAHRPTGLAVAPDGALFVSDSRGGHIWRITYATPG